MVFARLSQSSHLAFLFHIYFKIYRSILGEARVRPIKNRCMLNVYTLHVKNKKIVEGSNIKYIKEVNHYSNR